MKYKEFFTIKKTFRISPNIDIELDEIQVHVVYYVHN